MKLDKIYINEAMRIRKKYINSLKNILKEESAIQEKKEEVDKLQDNMESIVDKDMNDITKRLKLNDDLIKMERLINQVQNRIRPHYDNIESLRTDADKLYNSISEKYPNITEAEIQKEIAPYLKFE